MKEYLFTTTATMKPYNSKKWYIDGDIVRRQTISAETVEEALTKYREIVREKHYITISDSALKNKSPLFVDDKNGNAVQVGYVITGKTDFETDDYKYIAQYIDLWIDIAIIENAFTREAA